MSGRGPYWPPEFLAFELSAAREAFREPSFKGCVVLSGECIRRPFSSAATGELPRNCDNKRVRRF